MHTDLSLLAHSHQQLISRSSSNFQLPDPTYVTSRECRSTPSSLNLHVHMWVCPVPGSLQLLDRYLPSSDLTVYWTRVCMVPIAGRCYMFPNIIPAFWDCAECIHMCACIDNNSRARDPAPASMHMHASDGLLAACSCTKLSASCMLQRCAVADINDERRSWH